MLRDWLNCPGGGRASQVKLALKTSYWRWGKTTPWWPKRGGTVVSKIWEPPGQAQRSPGPSGPEPQKIPKRVQKGVPEPSGPGEPQSPQRVRDTLSDSFRTLFGFWARRALETSVWSAANGGLRDGGLRKSEDIWRKRPFSSVFWIFQVLCAPSGKGRKRQKKGEKGRFRPISGKGGQTPLKPPFVTPPFAATQSVPGRGVRNPKLLPQKNYFSRIN